MTWEQLMQQHNKELAAFMKAQILDPEANLNQDQWGARYKGLVAKHYNEANDLYEREQRERAEKRKVHDVIAEGQKAAAWIDTTFKHSLEEPNADVMKIVADMDKAEQSTDEEEKQRIKDRITDALNRGRRR